MPMITGSDALADARVDAHHERDCVRFRRELERRAGNERIVRSRSSVLTGLI